MLQNLAMQRALNKQPAREEKVVDPSSGMVPYEERQVTMWDFNGPAGPQQFMIEASEGDKVVEEKDRFKIRCRQGNIVMNLSIYKANLYFSCSHETMMRVRVTAKPDVPFTPTKKR